MAVSIQEVERIASLAKLRFSEEEKARLAEELDEIVRYVEKLDELDTEDVEPTSHAVVEGVSLREDKVESGLTPAEALQNAPARKQGYFSVPKVIP